ncbi:sensor histidine kinase [Streptomyces acidiscabies]|uniref:histidine kinase n=2 Tax=Streptomyces acidiscabies TaxID=42234 RepID=A0AAP6B4N3_9ACTN|nr:HAMP domain-containing sensor histidine kinase [Streptomyces acidiscabies]MBP5941334.1 HAMP domain-containing histidine kinase [Streptomyces sp. LBUM 1476]MBZ3912687.1 HAMP domain-containing histidine kinase [Streptomyces acidiscabies]MDX2958170.1 HAMP domain-containing sensor histidine kinase [Streptomyces acidiscabies]MDX3018537.1 HAMP domain-containing sensor histidine kinase [Streptomyces acidiscabies]MDX3791160.1 HAMP domain-containing sensor histidine kinase [Streptomyces acidiscabies
MRARVLTVVLAFALLAVAGFAGPLLTLTAVQRTQQLVAARAADLDRFATLAEQAAESGDSTTLTAEVDRYTELYGEAVVVVDARRAPVVQTGGLHAADPAVARLVDAALRSQLRYPEGTLRPWSRADVLLARPVGTGTRVSGAVVLRASVRAAADDVALRWALVLAGAGVFAAACVLLARRATQWVVRPLHRLDRAVGELAAGLPPERVVRAGGPPELRQVVEGFNRMADTVTTALEQQRRLVADTSHQLRNPLAALRLRIDSLQPRLPQAATRTYTGVTAELERMERLLDDLMTLADAEHRAGEMAVTDRQGVGCEVRPVIEAQVEVWRPVAEGALVLSRVGEGVVACTADELAQVVDILVDNAIKYGGGRVEVSSRATGTEVVIEVRDDGPGLSAGELACAGTRFWRAERHRDVRGSGLGLAIAERLVAGHGGRIEFEAGVPRGLAVRAVLPQQESRTPQPRTPGSRTP